MVSSLFFLTTLTFLCNGAPTEELERNPVEESLKFPYLPFIQDSPDGRRDEQLIDQDPGIVEDGAHASFPILNRDMFPGFSFRRSALIQKEELKSPPPHSKPDPNDKIELYLLGPPKIPQLWPYLFPGSQFPGFAFGGVIPESLRPMILQNISATLGIPLEMPKPHSGKVDYRTGVSLPLTADDVGESFTSSKLTTALSEQEGVEEWYPASNVEPQIDDFHIVQITDNRILINSKEKVQRELIVFLEESLKKFSELGQNQITEENSGLNIQQDPFPGDAVPAVPIASAEKKNITRNPGSSKPFGIQNNDNQYSSTKRPLIAVILNPLGSLPPVQWPDFSGKIQRLFASFRRRGSQQEKQKEGSLRYEDLEMPASTLYCNSSLGQKIEEGCINEKCSEFCGQGGRHLFSTGECLDQGCLCFLTPSARHLGLLFKMEQEIEILPEENCDIRCRAEGAYTGMCGGERNTCRCAVPWDDETGHILN